ncbi:MAG: ATP synthase F1 subunit gamma, partial [Bacteroidales bacterium]|nr:ATP synthase F1 subunit gamma [Bacteroidales bacterium]
MGNLKEIRTRITSIESTQKITSSMKLVSAAKLRRAQTAIQHLRPYSQKLNEILNNLAGSNTGTEPSPLFEAREAEKVVIVVITSNKGLCGAFNSNIVKTVNHLVTEKYAEQHRANNVQLICFGKKGKEQLSKQFPVSFYNEKLLDNPDFTEISSLADDLMKRFVNHEVDKVDIVYNQFLNAATQRVTIEDYLPVNPIEADEEKKMNKDYIIEPSADKLLSELIPKILRTQLYKTISDSIASEHGARMISMT